MSTEATATRQVAVAGRRDVVVPFLAAGLAVFPMEPGPDAARQVSKLVDDGYQIVFFTEDLFPCLGELLDRSRRSATPCLVALPAGGAQASAARLREVVKRAVGADIFDGTAAKPGKGVG